jgi:hypothetical protein
MYAFPAAHMYCKCTPHLRSGLPGENVLLRMLFALGGKHFLQLHELSNEHSMVALYHNSQIFKIFETPPRMLDGFKIKNEYDATISRILTLSITTNHVKLSL